MAPHRLIPPRTGPWEHPDLSNNKPEGWLIEDSTPRITNKFSWRLKDSLLTAGAIRLFRSTLREFDPEDDWQCWRYLGAGTFGAAAVFNKVDAAAEVVDEIVVKEITCMDDHPRSRYVAGSDCYIINEAIVHNDLRVYRSDNLIHLRDFKAIFPHLPVPGPSDPPNPGSNPEAFMRLYLEYAPYGTLNNLLAKYKAFNRYLPELFLWHLFNSLAKAVLTLEQNQPDQQPHFVAHLDIKPDNIFLGYETTKSSDPEFTGGLKGDEVRYPSIKLGDFGFARQVMHRQPISMREVGDYGTRYYYAPEIVSTDEEEDGGQYGCYWHPAPSSPRDNLTPKINIWGIGKVMYDAFSLSGAHHFGILRARNRTEYQSNGRKPVLDYATDPFERDLLHPYSPYTKALSDVIESCMHVEPSRRPTAAELYEITRTMMDQCKAGNAATLPFSVRRRELYYRGNEINDTPFDEKNCGKTLEPLEYFELLNPGNNDPEDSELQVYPEQIWETHTGEALSRDLEDYYRKSKNAHRGDYRFRRHIHQNQHRLRLRPRPEPIRILDDQDQELTYSGTADDKFFINESRRTYGHPRKNYDDDESSNDDSDDVNNGGNGNENDAGGGNDDGSGDGLNIRGGAIRTEEQPREALHDDGTGRRRHQDRFTHHYVPQNRRNVHTTPARSTEGSTDDIIEDPLPDQQIQQEYQRQTKFPRRNTAADFWNLPPESEPHVTKKRPRRARTSSASTIFSDELRQPTRLLSKDGHRVYNPNKRPRLSQVPDTEEQVRPSVTNLVPSEGGVESTGKNARKVEIRPNGNWTDKFFKSSEGKPRRDVSEAQEQTRASEQRPGLGALGDDSAYLDMLVATGMEV